MLLTGTAAALGLGLAPHLDRLTRRLSGDAMTVPRPVIAVATALVLAALAWRTGLDPALPAFLYLGTAGVVLAAVDIADRRLPDVVTLPSYAVGGLLLAGAALAAGDGAGYVRAWIGALGMLGLYLALAVAQPGGMGLGDVKLAGVLGLYLGWLGWGPLLVGAFAGFLLGGVAGILLIAARRATRRTHLPFGPFMLAGALVAILWGQSLADSYLRLTFG